MNSLNIRKSVRTVYNNIIMYNVRRGLTRTAHGAGMV